MNSFIFILSYNIISCFNHILQIKYHNIWKCNVLENLIPISYKKYFLFIYIIFIIYIKKINMDQYIYEISSTIFKKYRQKYYKKRCI